MARRPEPLEDLIVDATLIVVGDVTEVLETGAPVPPPPHAKELKPSARDVGYLSPRQRIRLQVARVLKGEAPSVMVVEKPEAPYLLKVGDGGPFFLEGLQIIGRYGPDSHRLEAIERALGTQTR
ncbi:MAG: hypothetical protein HY903_09155 [Deltaproteobacteria bacterium]|nr:hypothetical protein [Deltaproteobacteria bacterium]